MAMEANISKRMKVEEKNDDLRIDRLTSLPEALLIHIFSFLHTKEAIQLSLSLKKDLNLWKFLPDFKLIDDFRSFKTRHSFDKFVSKALTLRDRSVKMDRFSYRRLGTSKSRVQRVVNFIVTHDIQHLTFFLKHFGYGDLSFLKPLASCDSLKTLKFELYGSDYPFSFDLKHVVTLHLQDITLRLGETFPGCPNLKDLTLVNCYCDLYPERKKLMRLVSDRKGLVGGRIKFVWLKIVALQLSRLTIMNCFSSGKAKITLSTPRLISFKIEENLFPLLRMDDLVVLETVDLAFGTVRFSFDQSREQPAFSSLISMVKRFRNAKFVNLSNSIIQLLSKFPEKLEIEPSPFCNLKILKITHDRGDQPCCSAIPGPVTNYLLGKSSNAIIKLCQNCDTLPIYEDDGV